MTPESAQFQILPTLGGNSTRAAAINREGVVVGSATTSDGALRAFAWDPISGTMLDLGTLAGDASSEARAINDHGDIVGRSFRPGSERAVRWQVTFNRDDTAPVITPTISGTAGSDGWYTSDVSLTWSVTDAESPVTSPACAAASVTANTSGVTYSCTATSAGGSATRSVTIKRDASAPVVTETVTGTLGNDGWYRSNVDVSWSVGDDVSGIASSTGCSSSTLAEDAASRSYSCSANNGAGLSTTKSVTVKRDATNPVITFSGNAGAYTVDQSVAISCSASDEMSGVARASCPSIAADAYTLTIGSNSLTGGAEDNAGNTAAATTTFTVRVTYSSLCNLVSRWTTNAGVANSLCAKLRTAERQADAKAGALRAFVNEINAQSGKHVAADKAAILIALAGAL
jgi:probable HAF family extracellular repeat protein